MARAMSAVGRAAALGWLTGPIFAKELRVSSRRRRNYVLRLLYVALLTVFVVLVWLGSVRSYYGPYAQYRMVMAGKMITFTVMAFQFCALQMLAVVLMSTSVSDEVYQRTLGVLMTTPITSAQIVLGKLLSKLLQLVLLLAISLPLLAIVRVFGGVPWAFLVAGACVTFTAMLFAAAVSMFFSIYSRRAYAVILKTLLVGGAVYLLVPWLMFMLFHEAMRLGTEEDVMLAAGYFNPFLAGFFVSFDLMEPMRAGTFTFDWVVHCAIMLAASVGLLAICAVLIRRVALRQIGGQDQPTRRPARRLRAFPPPVRRGGNPTRALPDDVRRVAGSPMVWKETRSPLFRQRLRALLVGGAAVLILLLTYALVASENDLDDNDTHAVYVVIFVILGTLTTTILAATSITSEKEARSWPILLATPLRRGHILLGKAVGIARRCLPVWLLLAGHVVLFTLVGWIHPIVTLHLLIILAGVVGLLVGTGLFLGAAFRKTTTAVVVNLAFAVGLWLVLPFLVLLAEEAFDHYRGDWSENIVTVNPVVQAGVITERASGRNRARREVIDLEYQWPDWEADAIGTTNLLLGTMAGHLVLGGLFAYLAMVRMRKRIF